MSQVLVAGHLCLDIIPHIPPETARSTAFLSPGRLAHVGPMLLSTGGVVANTGTVLHRLGTSVRLAGRIGDDPIGRLTLDLIGRAGLCREGINVAVGEGTSYSVVINPPGADRSFLHHSGTNDTFGPEDIDDSDLRSVRLVHIGYPPLMRRLYSGDGRELEEMLSRAKACGATTSLDMAMPDPNSEGGRVDWPSILRRVLPHVDLFVPSADELLYMLQPDRFDALLTAPNGESVDGVTHEDLASLARECLDMGPQAVLFTLGRRGIYVRSGVATRSEKDWGRGAPRNVQEWRDRELWAPAFRAQAVGTTGAGDAAIAGFLAGWLRGQTPGETLRTASAVGACSVEGATVASGIGTWAQLQARLSRDWPTRPLGALPDGWIWDEEAGLYRGPNDSIKAR